MRSKTSCFNKTVFRKNLTRFAPVWGVYTLCLVVGILMLYSNGDTMKQFYFARHMTTLPEVMAIVNLVYAAVVAQLLFGDLYNSRMCNMLHAFPLRRETWFFTNLLSGFVFSLVPTLIMALVAFPLLTDSLFQGATALSWCVFLASNLQFICFFGMAVFCAMVVGNRFTMLAGYGLLNAGAMIGYWLVDTVYTPMLYGVITPARLASNLTPFNHMIDIPYIETSADLYDLREQFGEQLQGAFATFTITDNWWHLWMLAGVGLLFALLGLGLYRIRDLECAGSAVAFPVLQPVFQVFCAVFCAAAAQFVLYVVFLGEEGRNFWILAFGLVVGWFIAQMLLERSTRVFQLKNVYGLAALAAVLAVSLWLTHVDILGIETRLPDAGKVTKVTIDGLEFMEKEDIENLIALQKDAVQHRAETPGVYVQENGEWIPYMDDYSDIIEEGNPDNLYTYVPNVYLTYEMENGKQIRRMYNIWADSEYVRSEAGRIAESYLTRWEAMNRKVVINGVEHDALELALENLWSIYVEYMDDDHARRELATEENARSLIAAIQADCAEGNMAQSRFYHSGHFRVESEYAENGYAEFTSMYIGINGKEYGWSIDVFPDSVHTLQWLEDHGVLNVEVCPENIPY